MRIAICDKIGLCYDGNTLTKSGLGGSESAVILMSKELATLGFDVTVFNNCNDGTHSSSGTYDGVTYIDNKDAGAHTESYDIVIVSRTVEPFMNENRYPFLKHAKLKILWMHDTFCEGDQYVEELVVNKKIDYLFTLSDFHTDYVLNCDHGKKRNYEVLKPHVFQTRNGAVSYIEDVDISKKDKNHFVYNASVSKGLVTLLEDVWPTVKQNIPQARLTVIGGYYRFREGAEPDEQGKILKRIVEDERFANLDVTFTDIIPQYKIAEILANANFMIYPPVFPETFGISSLESLLYNTPIITSRFGALEETAIENACYLINYAVAPNSLFPAIDKQSQINAFISQTINAYNTPYLHQQKQNYCSVVRDVAGWNTVALQWKQFFYNKLGLFLSVDDYRKVTYINKKVSRIFGRTMTLPANKEYYSYGSQRNIVVVSPFWNAEKYIKNNILSVAQQDYDNYKHILIDDNSTDNSYNIAVETVKSLPLHIQNKFKIIKNDENRGAIFNQLNNIDTETNSSDIVMLLDGDDWLVNNNTIFHYYNNLYSNGYEFTYGSMWSVVDNIPLISQDYPQYVKDNRTYRNYKFNWGIPYTHLRTCLAKHFYELEISSFVDENGKWMKSGADNPLFYELIEQIDPDKIYCNKEIVCNYNDANPLNDYKINATDQTKNANKSYNKSESNIKMTTPDTEIFKKQLQANYEYMCSIPTDIQLHLPILKALADECDTVVEFGVRDGASTRALLASNASVYSYDLELNDGVNALFELAQLAGKKCRYAVGNSMDITIPDVDMVFIDTLHTYTQLSAELEKHHSNVKKYIAFHDTYTFGLTSEMNIDTYRGLLTAIIEFMIVHPEWKFKYHTQLNNGFTVLERTGDFYTKTKPVDDSIPENTKPTTSSAGNDNFSVVVPTMWRACDVMMPMLQKLCDHPRVDEIIIINNDASNTPTDAVLENTKIKLFGFGKNIYVNPAWNFGVSIAKNDKICILNDDMGFDTKLFDKVSRYINSDTGVIGISPGVEGFGQEVHKSTDITITEWSGTHTFGFGCLMFVYKPNWTDIPQGLQIYYGDNFIFDNSLKNNRKNYIISDIDFTTKYAQTTGDQSITGGILDKEAQIYKAIMTSEKFSVVIPTMWKANEILIPMLQKLCDHPLVDEIIIINNDEPNTPTNTILQNTKIKLFGFGKNIYVNPAWNFGVSVAKNDKICILNDDMWFDLQLFEKVSPYVVPENGVTGLCTSSVIPTRDTDDNIINIQNYTDGSITILETNTEHAWAGFGTLMFIHKSNWENIPDGMNVFSGDNFIFHNLLLMKQKKNFMITNILHENERHSMTTRDIHSTGIADNDEPIYAEIYKNMKLATQENTKMKTILIAIPTNKYIEPDTYKSIYDLVVPTGYKTHFQFFYGYTRTQIKNLISDWAKNYEYTIFIKPNIVLANDTLTQLVDTNSDLVSIDNFRAFGAKNGVFSHMVQYPHFEQNDTEITEIENFFEKAKKAGATHSHLTGKTNLIVSAKI